MRNLPVVKAEYDGLSVTFTEDGWFNATEVADKFSKRPVDWLALESTQEYISVLKEISKCEDSSLLKTKRGRHGSGTWMHPKLAIPFARWLDVRFAVWCDMQIDALITRTHPHYNWKRMRHEATSSCKVMNAVLQLHRQMQGKLTAPHHFSNEARLINWALTGEFKGLDRNSLACGDLDMLAKLEERNAVLMGVGLNYSERKKALEIFVADYRELNATGIEALA